MEQHLSGGQLANHAALTSSWSGDVESYQSRPQTNPDVYEFRTGVSSLSRDRFAYNPNSTAGNNGGQWDSDDEEEEEEEDEYYYNQETSEEKRRRLERMEYRNIELRRELRETMEEFWENTFYNDGMQEHDGENDRHGDAAHQDTTNKDTTNQTTASQIADKSINEREIHWHQYLTLPQQSYNNHQVPLPFDSNTQDCTSYHTGYSSSNNLSASWREHQMSESIRKVLERCDQVKGFNIFVDGGVHSPTVKQSYMAGGMYAGLSASILEELHDECKSAGCMALLVDSLLGDTAVDMDVNNENGKEKESIAVEKFQRCLNSGLTLHGLSTNADVFLPVSIEDAHRALFGDRKVSSNRNMFEGSAALSWALEESTLPYRLRSNSQSLSGTQRSRLGIQSGFYQGSVSNDNNDPFASADSLTYHEFLACMRSSSDKRRSILELDAMMHPLSFPAASMTPPFGQGGDMSSNILASLMSAGVIGGGGEGKRDLGLLYQRLMRGTSMEQMQMEQDRNYRSRNYSSKRHTGPGEWMEDYSGGGLLESLSGHSNFGRRCDHHHFSLSTALRPASSDVRKFPSNDCGTSAFLRPIMESMGVAYRPGVSSGVVVRDTAVDLTEVGSYWNSIFRRVKHPNPPNDSQTTPSAQDIVNHTPILSILGNSTRSYKRLHSISSGFVDSLHSRKNMGYLARDVTSGLAPEKDDCEDALEYCRELVDVYEPPHGSGLVDGEDENDLDGAYFDE
jgi:hypothetical protein